MKTYVSVILLSVSAAFAFGDDYLLEYIDYTPEAEQWRTGANIRVETQQQQYPKTTTDIVSTTLSAYVAKGTWSVGVQLPYFVIDGERLVIQGRPQVIDACNRFGDLSPQDSARLAENRPRLFERLQQCEQIETTQDSNHQGVGDVSTYVSYGDTLTEDGAWFGQIILGYIADNADTQSGLGSGTQDAYVELYADWRKGDWLFATSVAQNVILGGEYSQYYQDYGYGSVEIRRYFGAVSLALQQYWQQSAVAEGDDLNKSSIKLDYRKSDWGLHARAGVSGGQYYSDADYSLGVSYSF